MKQVIVNGQNYLAEKMVNGEGGLKVVQALALNSDNVTKGDVARYMKAQNLGELKDISFGGAGVAYSELDLDREIENAVAIATLVMKDANEFAVKKLVNKEFDAGLGKM